MKTLTESECGLVAGGFRKASAVRRPRRATAHKRASTKSGKAHTELLKPPHQGAGAGSGSGSGSGIGSGSGSGSGSGGFGSGSGGFGSGSGGGGSGSGSGGDADTAIGSSYVAADGRDVTITYQNTADGTSSDQPVTQNMNDAIDNLLNTDSKVNSIDISATTNGTHDPNSDHYNGNAVDINDINGVHVSASGSGYDNAQTMEDDAMNDPLVRYVEGPAGDFARSSPTSPWVRSANEAGMDTHVHISVFPGN